MKVLKCVKNAYVYLHILLSFDDKVKDLNGFYLMVLRKSFYIHWSAGRSPRVHEVNPGWDPSFLLSLFPPYHPENQLWQEWKYLCETPKNPDFLRKDKMVISVKIWNFSRSWMTKRTSPLESSLQI